MKKDNIEELLNTKAKSPAPQLTPDPFLPTRIEALVKAKGNSDNRFAANWSFASLITTAAIIIGIYMGAGIFESNNLQSNDDIFTEYSQAFYQSGFAESVDSNLESGGTDQ